MLSFLDIDEVDEHAGGSVCRSCGLTFADYSRESKLGCPDCYRYLGESLKSVIAGYHGASRHAGKHPDNPTGISIMTYEKPAVQAAPRKSVEELKTMLSRAVNDERYEEAAQLRDRIREMESL